VPFWIPGKRSRPEVAERNLDAEVIIVGGGPVGLLLANLLGKAGRRVVLIESSNGEVRRSMAIGITPPSLELLASLDLDHAFITRGVSIEKAIVHEERKQAGCLQLASGSDDYPYILSLPQSETVQLLRENLNRYPSVSVLAHCRAVGIDQDEAGVNLEIRGKDDASSQTLRAALVTACDGSKSELAEWLGVGKSFHAYAPVFMMGDFKDESGLGEEAHLFFGAERPIESFPLPGGRRRWIVRCGWRDRIDVRESLATVVTRLSGIPVRDEDQLDASRFQPQRKLARAFYRGRVALCGDAAHVMSPIGGQGMNTGFGDAAFLANAYCAILDGRGHVDAWMRHYEHSRKHAFRLAAARAAAGMTLGVARGRFASPIRRALVGALLGRGASHQFVQRWFTMRSLPAFQQQYHRAARLIEKELVNT
jgi:2-polyprenyl-6-methoxyphenol hydroxylase-like FAD-dependent oxidoreductase